MIVFVVCLRVFLRKEDKEVEQLLFLRKVEKELEQLFFLRSSCGMLDSIFEKGRSVLLLPTALTASPLFLAAPTTARLLSAAPNAAAATGTSALTRRTTGLQLVLMLLLQDAANAAVCVWVSVSLFVCLNIAATCRKRCCTQQLHSY